MPEGRVLNLNNTFVYEYQYKDHLGNLRVSFREANQVQYLASSELSNASAERTQFANVDATRAPHPTQSGQSACLTNAGKPLGLWKSMPISKGDKINAGVSAYYTQTNSMPSGINWALFPVQNPTYGNNEGGTRPFGLPFSLGVILLPNPTPSASVPVAYLRLVFYNAQNTIIQQSVRYVGGQNNLWQYYETGSIEALQNGRVEIYVVNESVPNVWFDNLTITHLPTLISQENHYYAFGMNAKEIEKEGSNRFQYNKMAEKNEFMGLDWYDTKYRNLDTEIGRWLQVDPKADEGHLSSLTPYNSMDNNPIRYNDPDGDKALGDIYNLNGQHIGNDGVKDNKVYILNNRDNKQLSEKEAKFLTKSTNFFDNLNLSYLSPLFDLTKKTGLNHNTFLELAGWAYNENTLDANAQKASLGMLNNWTTAKKDFYGFDHINTLKDALNQIYDHPSDPNTFSHQRDFLNTSTTNRNSNKGMRTSIEGLIHVVRGGKDYSNGAVQEHGRDFFIQGYPMFIDQQKNGYMWAKNGIFKGDYNPSTYPSNRLSNNVKYIITASYGGNIYATFSNKYKKP